MYSTAIQLVYTHTHIFFFRFFSLIDYYLVFDGIKTQESQGAGQLPSVGGRILIHISLTSKPQSAHYMPLCPSLSPRGYNRL